MPWIYSCKFVCVQQGTGSSANCFTQRPDVWFKPSIMVTHNRGQRLVLCGFGRISSLRANTFTASTNGYFSLAASPSRPSERKQKLCLCLPAACPDSGCHLQMMLEWSSPESCHLPWKEEERSWLVQRGRNRAETASPLPTWEDPPL